MERPEWSGERPTMPGTTVAERYRIVAPLGEGGMGQVYEAEHIELGRRFALKVLKLDASSDTLVARFRREAQALARLSTPHVAQVTDFGVDGSLGPFYVMELVEGETLEGRLERGVLTPVETARIGKATASALAEVHSAGLVHRDMKPSNIALPKQGPIEVKLLDFGLVAAVDDSFMTRITKSQQVLGSLPYMPPEAFDGASPTPQADLYALGVSLYEGLSGSLPFFAPSTAAMIHQIITAPVPVLASRVEGVPPKLAAVLERLLAKDPAKRFANAAELVDTFDDVLREGLASIPPTVLAPVALPPTVASPVSAHDVNASAPTVGAPIGELTRAPTSPSVAAPTARTPVRFVVAAFVAGLVLAALAAVVVVIALDATEPSDVAAPAVTPSVAPAAPPAIAPPPPPEAEGETDVGMEVETEAEADTEAEPPTGSEPEAGARRAASMSARRRRRPETEVNPPSVPPTMMASTWRGQRAIVDDSEFD